MIRSAEKSDARILAELAIQMWNDSTVPDLEKEVLLTCDTTNDASRRIIVKNPDKKLNQAPIVHIQ